MDSLAMDSLAMDSLAMDSLAYHLDTQLLTFSGSSWPVPVLIQSVVFLFQVNKLRGTVLKIQLFSLVAKKITCLLEDEIFISLFTTVRQ